MAAQSENLEKTGTQSGEFLLVKKQFHSHLYMYRSYNEIQNLDSCSSLVACHVQKTTKIEAKELIRHSFWESIWR